MVSSSFEEHDVQMERSLSLLHFLREFVKLRSRVVRDLAKYDQVIFFHDMPQTEGCLSPAWMKVADETLWLEVRKQVFPEPPALPDELEPWVDAASIYFSNQAEPNLRPVIYLPDTESEKEPGEEPGLVEHRLADFPEVETTWQAYLEDWQPWAEEHRRRATIQKLYNQLFDIYNKLKQQGEALELVIGFGLVSRKTPLLKRHAVTAKAELHFDQNKGIISLICPQPPEGAKLSIEDEFVDEKPSSYDPKAVQKDLEELGDDVWDTEALKQTLNQWGNAIASDIVFSDAMPTVYPDKPTLAFAPALILRKRSLRGILTTYDNIIEQISNNGAVPLGLARLIEHLDDSAQDRSFTEPIKLGGSKHPIDYNIYFPLPANDEQLKIVELLRTRQGILVQGPPGTGKSHTIANLISHLLAMGNRILVTSETPHALRVLKEKIPAAVQPLCVSLLGASAESFNELSTAVNGITERHSNPREYSRIIEAAERKLQLVKGERASVYKRLLELRESESYACDPLGDGTYKGTAAKIAERVNRERKSYGWIGKITVGRELKPQLSLQHQLHVSFKND